MELWRTINSVFFLGRVKFYTKSPKRPATCGVSHNYEKNHEIDDINTDFVELCLDDNEGRASVLEFNDADATHTDNEVKDISMRWQLTLQELKIKSIGSVSNHRLAFIFSSLYPLPCPIIPMCVRTIEAQFFQS